MEDKFEKFVISLGAIIIRKDKCLILEFSKYLNKWGLPGGRIDKGEFDAKKSLERELEEELGFSNSEILGVVDYEIYFNSEDKAKCNIIMLVKNDLENVKISSEHVQFKWVSENEIDKYKFIWPNMMRIIKNGFKYRKLLDAK